MKTTKFIIIIFLAFTIKGFSFNIDLDSMRNTNIIYSLGNFNQDCYLDTLYGKVYSKTKIIPEVIMWGQQDTTICDSSFVVDTMNYEYTMFISDSIGKERLSLNVYDINHDKNKDFIFNYRINDTSSIDSICQLIILSNNFLSRNQFIHLNNDSLVADSISYLSTEIYDSTNLTSRYDRYRIFIIDDEMNISPPPKKVNEKLFNDFAFEALVFPNPNNGLLNIEVSNTPYQLRLINLEGKLELEVNNIQQINKSFDISKLVNGSYLLELRNEGILKTFKILKVK